MATGGSPFADLFGGKTTLVLYTYMFGPQRERPCPMCTALLSAWDGEALDIQQRVAFAVIARSPIEKLLAFKRERGWQHLPLYSDPSQEIQPRLSRERRRRQRHPPIPRLHAPRRDDPPVLGRRDGRRDRRPRAGPARAPPT
ncbi:MAG: DUF899 family protein [Sphingomonas sp.]